eukprot:TRINITY_DN6658_c0_g1_i3.p1 TRINITY_DN6658_c0_g1~~TRINITY_DN6658_c0_g1_i3.p1  ORF type:complete len:338 (+),score=90.37 TRINITY_DN6658_c0_g1_i3:1702-2715(+)
MPRNIQLNPNADLASYGLGSRFTEWKLRLAFKELEGNNIPEDRMTLRSVYKWVQIYESKLTLNEAREVIVRQESQEMSQLPDDERKKNQQIMAELTRQLQEAQARASQAEDSKRSWQIKCESREEEIVHLKKMMTSQTSHLDSDLQRSREELKELQASLPSPSETVDLQEDKRRFQLERDVFQKDVERWKTLQEVEVSQLEARKAEMTKQESRIVDKEADLDHRIQAFHFEIAKLAPPPPAPPLPPPEPTSNLPVSTPSPSTLLDQPRRPTTMFSPQDLNRQKGNLKKSFFVDPPARSIVTMTDHLYASLQQRFASVKNLAVEDLEDSYESTWTDDN